MTETLQFDAPDHWPELHRKRTEPPPNNPTALRHWVHFQYVPTQHERDLERAVDQLLVRNAGLTRRWLAVDGESTIGKSHAITALVLRRAMQDPCLWYQRTSNGYLHVPYVYVVATSSSVRQMLADIAEFCGLTNEGSENALLKRLKAALPLLGTRLVIVDEAQMFRRKSPGASSVTDSLRSVVSLPVPFVFVGVNLTASALLRDWGVNNDTVRQLRRRHDMASLQRLTGPTGVADIKAFVTGFGKRMLEIPEFSVTGLSDPTTLQTLAVFSAGRPGTILETLKHAAVRAAESDRDLSADRIEECLPPPPESPALGGRVL